MKIFSTVADVYVSVVIIVGATSCSVKIPAVPVNVKIDTFF